MAKTSKIVSCKRKQKKYNNQLANWIKPTFATKVYNRCQLCWRPHWYIWDFKMCRICFRELASKWEIPWVSKSSW
jgi:small subunit ribosomal protein S14